MDPQDVPGMVPETHHAVDQVDHSVDQRPEDEDLQVVPQPLIMNAGERDEIQEDDLFMDDDDGEDYESGQEFSASSDSSRDESANNGQAEASDTSDSEEGQNEESDSDHDSDRDVYHYPRWNLVAVDENGRPLELHIHRPSTLRRLVARTQTTNSSYVFWYMLRAVFAGSLPVVSTLLALGMDPNDPRLRYPDGATALHVAAFRGHAEIVLALLRFGAHVSAVCNARCTPLHLAAIPGCLQVAVSLLSAGANVDALDRYGHTPICYAVSFRRGQVFRALKAFRRVLRNQCEGGKRAERSHDREASSGQHFFTLLFPRPK
ncbi:hypothetical protein R5R35_003841 [Gryllus longicercus]|uniref:Uncharacterized protein n=1 Tax=Gryllus longicercus TaxID=2509291 RepID=A0AAN9Z959_9ORTH